MGRWIAIGFWKVIMRYSYNEGENYTWVERSDERCREERAWKGKKREGRLSE